MKTFLMACATLALFCSANAAQANQHLRKPPPRGLHLYLSTGIPSGNTQVLRYPLVKGIPLQLPDRVFPGVGAPTALGSDGTFYATQTLTFGGQVIDAFDGGSPTPTRRISLALGDFAVATALTVGPGGYLYVGYATYISEARIPAPDNEPSESLPTHGVAVYAPNANGAGPPLLAFRFAGMEGGPQSLAFDAQGHLHAGGFVFESQQGFILNIVDPQTAPKLVSRIELTPGVSPQGMECSDDGENIYVLGAHRAAATVLVFPRQAFGRAKPLRAMQISGGNTLAIAGPYVYTNVLKFQGPNELVAYPKHGNGSPQPVFARTYHTQADSVSIGP